MASKRMAGLARVLRLYDAVEQMHAAELHAASFALSEAENAIALARKAGFEAHHAGRVAISAGEREEWMLAEARQEVVGIRRERMEEIRESREMVRGAARTTFDESRVRAEQVKQVVEELREQADVDAARRTQSASDDRFLTRLRWQESTNERRQRLHEARDQPRG